MVNKQYRIKKNDLYDNKVINLIAFIKEDDEEMHEIDYTPTTILTFEDLNIGWNKKNAMSTLKIFIPVLIILIVVIVVYRRKASNLKRKLEEEMNSSSRSSYAGI